MDKYSYKGRRKAVERFTNWHGLGILVVISAVLGGLLLLWMLGYLHFDVDWFSVSYLYAQKDRLTG
jgi:hypothetical protein